MRYERDGYSVDAARAKGRPLPDWYLEEPPEHSMWYFYKEAFWNLSTERRFEFGPIPHSEIQMYGTCKGLDADMTETFVVLVRALDGSFLKWSRKDLERDRPRDG